MGLTGRNHHQYFSIPKAADYFYTKTGFLVTKPIFVLKVKLNEVTRITGIITKGRNVIIGDTANEFVSKFRVLHSLDGRAWEPYSSASVSDQVTRKDNYYIIFYLLKEMLISIKSRVHFSFDLSNCQCSVTGLRKAL